MNPHEHSELVAAYGICEENIRTFLDRQIAVTNFGGLMFAAIVGYGSLLPSETIKSLSFVLQLVTYAAGGWCIVGLLWLQDSIFDARGQAQRIRAEFSGVTRRVIDAGPERGWRAKRDGVGI